MDPNCSSNTRSFSRDDNEERKELMIDDDSSRPSDYIYYYTSHNTKDSSPNLYYPNSSGKQVIIKRGRPRKYWPEYSDQRQNIYHQRSKKDDQIPSLVIATQPRNEQDLTENTLLQRNDYSSRSKNPAERREIGRHLETVEGSRIGKHASNRVDIPPSETRHSRCTENKLYYSTRIGSAFTPARGQSYRPCCHGNIQKYSEPYFLPCYPLMLQEEQVTSPRLDREICYHTPQLTNYSHPAKQNEMAEQSSSKNPIIIDCFSLAINGNDDKIPMAGENHDMSVKKYRYEDEHRVHKETNDPLHPEVIKVASNKFQHNCLICQRIATGEAVQQLRNTSVIPNECSYQTNQAKISHCTISSTGNPNDESSLESCCDNRAHATIESEDVYGKTSDQEKKPSSPVEVRFKQEHEMSESQEATMRMKEERRTVINSAFSDPNEKKSTSSTYESNLQVLRRQETRIIDVDTQKSLPNPSLYYPSTNTEPLYSPDNMTGDNRNSLKRKWEAMYDILEEPDKTNKKSYFCNHCGRAFTHLSSLNNHIRTHTGQKPFRCRYCGKRFAQSGVLTAHLRTHTGEKPFNCVLCGKRFAQTTTLANHIRTHTGQKPFSCRYCKRTFAQSSTRNKHELSHTKEKPFECKYCGRSFTQSATVMRHMRIHMRDTKYTCVHCGKTFAYLYSLDKHLDEHT